MQDPKLPKKDTHERPTKGTEKQKTRTLTPAN